MDESVAPPVKRWVEIKHDWDTEPDDYAHSYPLRHVVSIHSGVDPDSALIEQSWVYSTKLYGPRLAAILAYRKYLKLEPLYPLFWLKLDDGWQAKYLSDK